MNEGTDYTVAYKSNTDTGTATITLTGKGNYSGTASKTFKIAPAPISKAALSGIKAKYYYTGTDLKPAPTLKFAKKILKANTDYTVSYKSNLTEGTGKETITIKGKGKFTGTVTKTFEVENMGDDLVRTACKLSYSRESRYANGFSGTSPYISAYKGIYGSSLYNKSSSSSCQLDCGRGMTTAIRHSGYDKSYPKQLGWDSGVKKQYFTNEKTLGKLSSKGAKRWKIVGHVSNTDSIANLKENMKRSYNTTLLPGDVIIRTGDSNHTCMYVGRIADEVYKKNLKGHTGKSGGVQGTLVSGSTWVASHYTKSALGICPVGKAAPMHKKQNITVIRCVSPQCK